MHYFQTFHFLFLLESGSCDPAIFVERRVAHTRRRRHGKTIKILRNEKTTKKTVLAEKDGLLMQQTRAFSAIVSAQCLYTFQEWHRRRWTDAAAAPVARRIIELARCCSVHKRREWTPAKTDKCGLNCAARSR